MANYKGLPEQTLNTAITAFNFERVHKRLVKENLAYYTNQENQNKHIPTVTEMVESCEAMKTSMMSDGISDVTCDCFKMVKNKKGDSVKLTFDFSKAKMFT